MGTTLAVRRPLLLPAVSLAAGIAFGAFHLAERVSAWVPLAAFVSLAALASVLAGIKPQRVVFVFVCASSLALGCAAGVSSARPLPEIAKERTLLIGVVTETPFAYQDGESYRLKLRSVWLNEEPFERGMAQLSVYDSEAIFSESLPAIGDVVALDARVSSPARPTNPGQIDARQGALVRGVALTGWSPEAEVIGRASVTLAERAALARERVEARVSHLLPGWEGDTLKALLLGARTELGDFREDLADVGVVHVLSVSGLHVGFVALALLGLLRLARLPEQAADILCAVGVWSYAWLVGMMPPVTRAAIMATALCLSRATGRKQDGLNTLSAAFIVSLLLRPLDLLSTSFQMSFAAVLGIVLLQKPVAARFCALGLPKGVSDTLSVSPAAQAGIAPVLLRVYGRSPLISVVANLPIVPVAAAAVYAGLAMLAFSVLGLAPLARVCAYVVAGLIRALATLAAWFARAKIAPWMAAVCAMIVAFPGKSTGKRRMTALLTPLAAGGGALAIGLLADSKVFFPRAMLLTAAGMAGCAVFYALMCVAQRRFVPSKPVRRVLTLTFAGALAVTLAASAWAVRPNGLTCVFLDVGQGDGALLRAPDGRVHLIDTGARDTSALLGAVSAYGSRIATVFISHPHDDHAGGLEALLGQAPVERVVVPKYMPLSDAEDGFLRGIGLARALGVEVVAASAGDIFDLGGGARAAVLWPVTVEGGDANRSCLVLDIGYEGRSLLFTGDIGLREDAFILAGDVDVLKVAHHGAREASGEAFLRGARPELAVISAGAGNAYGHPSPETLKRLDDIGARVLRTDVSGAVTVRLTKDGVQAAQYNQNDGGAH